MKQLKDKNYAFRISEKNLNAIKLKAKKAKLTVKDYITKSALDKEIVVIDGLPDIVNQLKKIGNNLNQLTMLSHQGKINTINFFEIEKVLSDTYWKINSLAEVTNRDGGI